MGGLRLLNAIGKIFGVDLRGGGLGSSLATTKPPWYTTVGLKVRRSEFQGMPVWSLRSRSPSDKVVIGLHGGGFVLQPTIMHWVDYAILAHQTRATVVVPIYPLICDGGTANTVIPQIADFISQLSNRHGAMNVGIYGDSAGATIALACTQELVRRGASTPARMVLVSPALDLTRSNPAISLIDDPVLAPPCGSDTAPPWAGELTPTDPMVSPLFGSLNGLPATAIYAGSLEILAPDVLRLQEKAHEGADFTFTLRKGEIHDWAGPNKVVPFTTGASFRAHINRQLIGSDDNRAPDKAGRAPT